MVAPAETTAKAIIKGGGKTAPRRGEGREEKE
jgi:hypothetical protein